ncbi:HAD-like domain-containing protein, partial [Microdochium trichocladiopsis]
AFAFDIDGVLMRGKTPVPGAREALLKLHALKIPFILLTNGGGHTEAAHVAQLGDRLSLPAGMLTEAQFVQSHTPFRDLVAEYRDQTILALGGSGQSVRNLALAYGFRRVVTSSDIMAWQDSVHPFPEMTRQHHAEHGRPLLTNTEGHGDDKNDKATRSEAAAAAAAAAAATATASTRISAILVFSSPRDWCLDLQIVTDLLLSEGGVVGGRRSPKNGDKTLPNRGYLQDGQPKLFFCNPDFEWATSHPHPRFAQGAFREALEGVWRFATRDAAAGGGEGVRLEYTIYGKPTDRTYVYGERPAAAAPTTAPSRRRRDISHVYMIGDNPESDIIGANSFSSRFGASWKSILVETGIYVAGTKPVHEPDHIARDVQTAVEWALMQ